MKGKHLLILGALLLGAVAAAQKSVILTAADGVKVHAEYHAAASPARGTLLLFHQLTGNLGEYSEAIPRLLKEGFNLLAVDQRVGGNDYERQNQTKKALPPTAVYQRMDALKDLEAALAWARAQNAKNIIVAGSSYSAALVFLLAAKYPADVAGVMAFSPGEYLNANNPRLVQEAAAKLKVPVFVAVANRGSELRDADPIFKAVPGSAKTLYVPEGLGIHGAAALRNPLTREKYWAATQAFLARFR